MKNSINMTLTFDQAVDGFLLAKRAEQKSTNTLDQYAWAYAKFSNWLPTDATLDAITTTQVREFLVSVETLSAKSVHAIQAALSSLWTWAVAEGYAERHVVRPIPLPKIHDPDIVPLTQAEVKRLLAACDTTRAYQSNRHPEGTTNRRHTALRDRAIILFLLDTGIRASELCALRVSDVNMETRAVEVMGKGRKKRTVYFAKRCHQALWRYQVTRQPHLAPNQPLFHVGEIDRPDPFDRCVLSRLLTRIGRRAGVEPANPHRFRHTFAIEFLRNGGNLFALQDLLGHTKLEMVRRYARLVQADREAAHKLASPADNWRL
jgi:site-specific recombinase XerD